MMARRSDAELCRQKGWGPGQRLIATYYPNGFRRELILTAIGERAILWRLADDDWTPLGPELKSSGMLHQYVICEAAGVAGGDDG